MAPVRIMKNGIYRYRTVVQTSLVLLLTLLVASTPSFASYESALSAYNKGDYATAFREWRILGIRGVKDAQYHLAEMYARGEGVPKDNAEAFRWYRRAAMRGNANAQLRLAQRYFLGLGIKQDLEEAAAWSKIAVKTELPDAMYLLGAMYLTGQGVEKNSIYAYAWFDRAAALGYEKAKEILPKVAKRMSYGEINRAKRLFKEKQKK